ncbi:MAG: DUF5615 family PIN-like protein [Verrucomicrobia bacterium]|nr:DUF5615 family PIN-like protein [Verrucomicrobiota bacterium]
MKLLFDENLPVRLVRSLADVFPSAAHVTQTGLGRADDGRIWDFARQNNYCIVSKDSDHHDLAILRGHPPKVVWIRLGNCTTRQIEDCLRANKGAVLEFLAAPGESAMLIP